MLSATPHDGSAKRFASLMGLLDPTALSDPEDYSRRDLECKERCVRRFKKDIQHHAGDPFYDPEPHQHRLRASPEEQAAYIALLAIRLTQGGDHQRVPSAALQRISLQKALFSSPAAALAATDNRIHSFNTSIATADELTEIDDLNRFRAALQRMPPERFSQYHDLVELLRSPTLNGRPSDPDDR